MRKYLLPENGQFYKANIHCHSTVSDGRMTPEEVKKVYMDQGYSIVAFTDHNVFIPHPELADENFLPLNGFELDISEEDKIWRRTRTCHICYVALDPDNDIHPLWHRSKYLCSGALAYQDKVKFDDSLPDYERTYTPECISEMMRIGRESGFFVTYNHPRWSLETYEQYINYHNMHAMEIYNTGCAVAGFPEYNGVVYDEMLRSGKQILCIATDDNHGQWESGNPRCDCCGGYIMIKAEKLEYKTITDALLAGNFYSSTGPEIHSLWYDSETNSVHLECSKAKKIVCTTGTRRTAAVYPYDFGGEYVESADFELSPEDDYVRFTVFDEKGGVADTNAYFLKQLQK